MGRVPSLTPSPHRPLVTLAVHDGDFAGLKPSSRFDGLLNQRKKVAHSVRDCVQDRLGCRDPSYSVVLQILVGGQEDVERLGRETE